MAEQKNWDKEEIGVLWKKQSNAGQAFYSGKIKFNDEEIEVVCFPNKFKTEDKHPDIRIYLSDKKQ